jgi:hypothetical protein
MIPHLAIDIHATIGMTIDFTPLDVIVVIVTTTMSAIGMTIDATASVYREDLGALVSEASADLELGKPIFLEIVCLVTDKYAKEAVPHN